MKTIKKKRVILVSCLSILMLLVGIMCLTGTPHQQTAFAAEDASSPDFVFTLITNENGEQEYKVALDATERPIVEKIIIPDTWNGLPVTEIADGGFMSCAKLKTVILPTYIRKIGKNAFANNASLQRVNLSKVKHIDANAFAMCPLLDKLFIPDSVENVGATILRNNAHSIYVQSSLNDVQAKWNANWSANRTGGTIEYDVKIDDVVFYREIFETPENGQRAIGQVIGYEIYGFAWLYEPDEDLTIYSSYQTEDGEYKPILNIAPEAFAFSTLNSLTIKHRHVDEPDFPVFNHSINIMSAAFKSTWIKKISLEVDVTLNHTDLPSFGSETFESVEGDEYAKSTNIFLDATTEEITFTDILDTVIGQGMFSGCAYLKTINIASNKENRLPNVERIGKEAFSKCTSLDTITIPSSVTNVESDIFYDWGKTQNQTINIEKYEGAAPIGLARANLEESFNNTANVTLNYIVIEYFVKYNSNKPTIASNSISGNMSNSKHIYYLDSTLSSNLYSLSGWRFTNWNTKANGSGTIYTNNATIKTLLDQDDAVIQDGNTVNLYAQWTQNTYTVTLNANGGVIGSASTVVTFDNAMPSGLNAPTRTGYEFQGYYSSTNGSGIKYYHKDMSSARPWNLTNSTTLYAHWTPKEYRIMLDAQNGNGGSSVVTAIYNKPMPTATAPTRYGYDFGGYWTGKNGTGTQYYTVSMSSARNWNISNPATLYAKWTAKTYTVIIHYGFDHINLDQYIWDQDRQTYSIKWDQGFSFTFSNTHNFSNKNLANVTCEYKGLISVREDYPAGPLGNYLSKNYYSTNNTTVTLHTNSDLIGKTIYIGALYQPPTACVAPGTLITLADGSQKAVEQLTGDESLLVWNLFTGNFDTAPIIFIDNEPMQLYKVINLTFSDNTTVKVISEHGFWDCNLSQYVYLNENAELYIGHWFNKQISNTDGSLTWTRVQLIDVTINEEYTTAWSPVTYGHLCYYVNGMLSMPGGISGLFNIFDVDSETLTINHEAYLADIEEYGLFTYEEFNNLFPVSIEIFDAFQAKYFKVAIGKGLLSYEKIEYLLNRYAEFLS